MRCIAREHALHVSGDDVVGSPAGLWELMDHADCDATEFEYPAISEPIVLQSAISIPACHIGRRQLVELIDDVQRVKIPRVKNHIHPFESLEHLRPQLANRAGNVGVCDQPYTHV